MKVFAASRKSGRFWEDCRKVIKTLNKAKFDIRLKSEKDCEIYALGKLKDSSYNEGFVTQRRKEEPKTRVTLFGQTHRSDMSVGKNGTAVEIKLVTKGDQVRAGIGQSIFYRTEYRFVVLLLIDATYNHSFFEVINDKKKIEHRFCKELEDLNIFVMCKKSEAVR